MSYANTPNAPNTNTADPLAGHQPVNIVILAAGQGKRMHSDAPKVLHRLAGRPLLEHVIRTARSLGSTRLCVVYGHGGEAVRDAFNDPDIAWVRQDPQMGTGHALQLAVPQLSDLEPTLVLYGDVPLIRAETLRRLRDAAQGGLAILTVELDDPKGYGRVLRTSRGGPIRRIVEDKDATPEERSVREVNTGIMLAPTRKLKGWLARLTNDNAQREYYLTDVVAIAASEGMGVAAAPALLAWTPFINSLNIFHTCWYLLLLPLSLGISVVYKAVRMNDLTRFWREVAIMTTQVVLAMIALAILVAVLVQVVIPWLPVE